jgi:hypothetical protein
MKTRHTQAFLTAVFLCLFTFPSARAGFVPIMNPGNADPLGGTYVSATHLITITAPEFSMLSSVTDGTLTASFSTQVQVLEVSTGSWGSWSSPPFSENANPTVLWTQGLATLTITFSKPVNTFGVEMEPNQIGLPTLPTMTATFFAGALTAGSIVRSVDGDSGARLFAAVATSPSAPFTKVVLSNNSGDFGIAELRYSTPAVTGVPELSTLSMLASSLPGLIVFTHYYKRSRRV